MTMTFVNVSDGHSYLLGSSALKETESEVAAEGVK